MAQYSVYVSNLALLNSVTQTTLAKISLIQSVPQSWQPAKPVSTKGALYWLLPR